MTYGDIVVKVVAEITGEPLGQVREVVMRTFGPAEGNFRDELPLDDAKSALDSLRTDPSDLLSRYAANKGDLRPRHPGLAKDRK